MCFFFLGEVVLIEGQAGGSIVGITPGAALGGGGSIVGITPGNYDFSILIIFFFKYFVCGVGAALEKKSVRDMAAGLNRLGGK